MKGPQDIDEGRLQTAWGENSTIRFPVARRNRYLPRQHGHPIKEEQNEEKEKENEEISNKQKLEEEEEEEEEEEGK
ncbi:hypothetical protein E2C01_005531 [Portunus trituberculatus]|uniref:Uncharacterized protein n=1 Tax=Portunus trituberculatus TaxID=210409 RepID=A0A5B7CTQ9_PORTR|nr:hypothetical protein [Portunus trituberculatus]